VRKLKQDVAIELAARPHRETLIQISFPITELVSQFRPSKPSVHQVLMDAHANSYC
jgi:hypothetical protein